MVTRLSTWLIGILFFLTSSVFYRGVRDSFDLTKATVLWIFLPAMAVLYIAQRIRNSKKFGAADLAAFSFLGALLVAAATSHNPWVSILGQPARYTGLLSLIFCVFIFLVTSRIERVEQLRILHFCIFATVVPTVGYVALQVSGADPFEWYVSSFGNPVFSTIGNPNTASGVISCLVPLGFGLQSSVDVKRVYRIFAGGLSVAACAAVGILQSFQGTVVVGISIAFFIPLFGRQSKTLRTTLIGFSFLALCGFAALQARSHLGLLASCVGGLFLSYALSSRKISHSERTIVPWRCRRQVFASIGVGTLALFVLARDRIADEIAGGFVERGDFYRSAVGVFERYPLFGSGLETFGEFFTQYRPSSHAINLEESRTSSVHSIPLAMFQSGGLLLGLAFVAFIVLVSIAGVKSLRASIDSDTIQYSVVSAWFAFLVQSLVSVEHVSLYFLFFLLAGVVISYSRIQSGESVQSSGPRRNRREKKLVLGSLGIIAAILSISLFPLFSRPFRSQIEFVSAGKYLERGELDRGLSSLDKAIDLNPQDYLNLLQRGEIYRAVENFEAAAADGLRAAELTRYSGGVAILTAQWMAEGGRFTDAASVLTEAVRRDPYAPTLKMEALNVLRQIEVYLASNEEMIFLQAVKDAISNIEDGVSK